MSALLSMMMGSGGGAKTLNLVSVNGATYDDDYIFTNNGSNKYFETVNELELTSQNTDFTFIIKFQYSSFQSGIYRLLGSNTIGLFSGYINLSSNFWGVVDGNYQALSSISSYNTWYWIKIERYLGAGARFFHFSYSTDGINYTEYYSGYSAVNVTSSHKLAFGIGTSASSEYNFTGKIDFKGCDIIINGQSVLWI